MEILSRYGSFVVLRAKDGSIWFARRKKLRHSNRRQKKRSRVVYFPYKTAIMEIVKTYIVNWKDDGYYDLCKVHLLEDGSYVREYDTGKRTRIVLIDKSEWLNQSLNNLNK